MNDSGFIKVIKVLAEVGNERESQESKWGQQNHPSGTGHVGSQFLCKYYRDITDNNAKEGTITWLDILREEVYEAFAETDPVKVREELVQVAAVAVAWVEAIDRDNF